ncbi:hypothetical protein AB0A63_16750 [Lentzea sp. NPDC042327]|uniref:hypothetical protein n=1 Tax=Lentzea sp. NPDC042327 TaxID=3154801 RepID=UPI0033FECB5A
MSKTPDGVRQSDLNVIARNVLLDGLEALWEHRASITVVGAQAVYLRTQHAQLATPAFTSDGDLGLDPRTLDDEPLIQERLRAAGFELLADNQPGLWGRRESVGGVVVPVELDLLVGEKLAGPGSRSASIQPHDKMTARRVPGLETAIVDRSLMTITALDGGERSAEVNVAGPAALLVAKAHKIHDRLGRLERLTNKDAGDVYRLMVGVPRQEVISSLRTLVSDALVGDVTKRGLEYLREQFGGPAAPGVLLAVDALAGDIPAERIRLVAPAYVAALEDLG